MDVNSLTDEELVAAANEYIQRTVRRMDSVGLEAPKTVMLYASVHGKDYKITHDLHYGSYSNEIKLTSGNLFELIKKHAVIKGIHVTPPVEITPMLSAPESVPDPLIEEAHFTEVSQNWSNDDVPF